jgi:hypothetical protein
MLTVEDPTDPECIDYELKANTSVWITVGNLSILISDTHQTIQVFPKGDEMCNEIDIIYLNQETHVTNETTLDPAPTGDR